MDEFIGHVVFWLLLIVGIMYAVGAVLGAIFGFVAENFMVILVIVGSLIALGMLIKYSVDKENRVIESQKSRDRINALYIKTQEEKEEKRSQVLAELSAEKTRGKFENYVWYKIEEKHRSEVIINYFFSAKNDNWKFLIFRCRNTLPLDTEDLLKMRDRGMADLIYRRVVATQVHNEISSGYENENLNGRLFGEFVDRPVHSSKEMFFYCIMLQDHNENLTYLDGKQYILEKYTAEQVEQNKTRKALAKSERKQVEGNLNVKPVKEKTPIESLKEELEGILNKDMTRKEMEGIESFYLEKISSNPFLSDDEREDTVDMIREKVAQHIAK